MLETVWIKYIALLDAKNNKTYRLDMTLVVTENVVLQKMSIGNGYETKNPMIVLYANNKALVFIGDMLFLCPNKRI